MLAVFSPDAIQAGKEFVIVYAGTVYAQRVEIRPQDVRHGDSRQGLERKCSVGVLSVAPVFSPDP